MSILLLWLALLTLCGCTTKTVVLPPLSNYEQQIRHIRSLQAESHREYSKIPREITQAGECQDFDHEGWHYFCDYFDHKWARRKECANGAEWIPDFRWNINYTCISGAWVNSDYARAAGEWDGR